MGCRNIVFIVTYTQSVKVNNKLQNETNSKQLQ